MIVVHPSKEVLNGRVPHGTGFYPVSKLPRLLCTAIDFLSMELTH